MTTPFECPGCGAKIESAYSRRVWHHHACPAYNATLRETYGKHWPLREAKPNHDKSPPHYNLPDPHLWVTQALADGLRQAGITAGHMRGIDMYY